MHDTSPLIALADLISSGVRTLDATYSQQGVPFPSLDGPYSPGPLDTDATVTAATQLIIAAAHQLIATVQQPVMTLLNYAPATCMTSAMGLVTDVHVPDALKDNPEGLHVDQIGAKVDIDPKKLARVLRYLATRHVFKEVAPDVFANNRVSSALMKSQPLEQLKLDKLRQYDGASAAALVGHMTDEGLRSNGYFVEFVRDSPKGVDAPFNLAFNTKASIWEWFEEPGNEWRGRRFATAMTGNYNPRVFMEGYDWNSLERGSVVVDVGGGIGTTVLNLAQAYPHVKYIVQDLEKVVGEPAQKYWQEQAPELVSNGIVTLQGHSFLEPQPVKGATVYFLRLILHDWRDSKCLEILQHLRAAAAPSSKLIVFDMLMPYACPDPAGPSPTPFPLLANLGIAAGGFATALDLQMMSSFTGQERTLSQFSALGDATGWKLESVKPGPLAAMIFYPV
ncbi:S-adenosyl-L-methionine-dependent methyltransferase [Artomyces pyxidatus]|uniref:S-adenosyl-L-methionine-dependent methyltransferase n=1 Tax=Artomyces pyxidatus TaxID=48021 RepID=A0ACB8T8A2_9AGAM|nr:S-adenosyl-L-methionine-dependent methyltransferase [Artomyces pyxidatus]